jgi:hypothetical protein
MKNSTIAKYFALAALLMFAAANYRKKDAEENGKSEEEDGK